MLLRFGRVTRLFKSFSSVAKNSYESGSFSALRYQPVTYLRLQFLCNAPHNNRHYVRLHREKLVLDKDDLDTAPYNLTEEQKLLLCNGDKFREQELEKLLSFLYICKQRGDYLPTTIKLSHLDILLEMNYAKRKVYLRTLTMRQLEDSITREIKLKMAREVKEARKTRAMNLDPKISWLDYHVFGNALFQRILRRTVNITHRFNEALAMQFHQHLVIDFAFDHIMKHKEATTCARQIISCISANRRMKRPYNLTFCNFFENEKVPSNLLFISTGIESSAITFSEKDVLELYPREKLVYLTPHSPNYLVYNNKDIYIIGALVSSDSEPHSAGKAKRLGIRTARMPVDKVADWDFGSRILNINQVFNILATVRNEGNWAKACAMNLPVVDRNRRPGEE